MALILVVEPDADLRNGLRTMLKSAGHFVEAVTSGGDAERAVADTRHDVVISDVSLPDGPGLRLMERFERDGHKTIVVVPHGERLLIERREDSIFCRRYSRRLMLQIIERNIEISRLRKKRNKKKLRFVPAPLRPMFAKLRA